MTIKTISQGLEYDTETREFTYGLIECGFCNGKGIVDHPIYCPNKNKSMVGTGSRTCKYCGTTRKDDHKIIGWTHGHVCPRCNGTKVEQANRCDFFDLSKFILENVEFFFSKVAGGNATFNESYLGIGIIGGVTDYGRYITETKCDPQAIMELVKNDVAERAEFAQPVAYTNKNGKLIEKAFIVLRSDGYSVYAGK